MREMFARFPKVLLIDATHGTNRSKFKIFSKMAHDVFRKGQYVQHAVMQNERSETLMTAINAFNDHNPDWRKLQVVVVDKDFTEISVLSVAFPTVQILLCQFHVLKRLREEISSDVYHFTAWKKERLQEIVVLLVYAKTEREYDTTACACVISSP